MGPGIDEEEYMWPGPVDREEAKPEPFDYGPKPEEYFPPHMLPRDFVGVSPMMPPSPEVFELRRKSKENPDVQVG